MAQLRINSAYDSEEEKKLEYRQKEDGPNLQNLEGGGEGGGPASSRGNLRPAPDADEPGMVQKPRQDRVYDADDSQPVTRPNLQNLEGGGEGGGPASSRGKVKALSDETDKPGTDKNGKSIDSPELLDKEKDAADSGAKGLVGKAEKGLIGQGLNTTDKFLPPQARIANVARKVFTKKKSAAGGIAGVIAGILVFGFTIGVGPLKLVHLSQIFQKNGASNEENSSKGIKGLFRYYRTDDIGETRVTKLGSEVFKRTVAKLEGIGYDFSDRNKLTGHLKSISIDAQKHPAFKGLKPGERQAAILKHFSISDPSVLEQKGQNSFKLNLDATTVKGISFINDTTGTALGDLQDGRVSTAMNGRVLKKFYRLPKLFSPISKRLIAKENGLANKAITRQEKRAAEKERGEVRLKTLRESPFGVKSAAAKDKLKGVLDAKRVGLTAGLTITAGACLARDVKDIGPAVDRAEIVVPAALEATDKDAVGSKVQSGDDLDARDAGVVSDSLIDENGKDVFGARGMQVMAGKLRPNGPDIEDKHKSAFADKFQSDIEDLASSVGAVACSTPSLLAQGALGIALVFTGPGGWVVNAAKTAASGAATAAILAILLSKYTDSLEDKARLDLPLRGPVGGNLMAYGQRERDNITARAMGAIELPKAESDKIDAQLTLDSQREFQSKSFASRLFDVNDYRSLAGNFIDSSSIDPGQNITAVASSLANVSSLESSLFAAFTPRAYAADPPYDWGFNRYAIPSKLIDSPNYADPYANAEKAAQILNGNVAGASTARQASSVLGAAEENKEGIVLGASSQDYIDKAKKCFGVKLTKDSGKWLATPEEEVDPRSEEYKNANCDDTSDGNWNTIIMFVFHDRLIVTADCWEGGEESCKELGFATETATADTTSGGTEESASETVDIDKLGTNSDKVSCAPGTNDFGVVTTKYTGDAKKETGPLIIRICELPQIPGQGNDKNGNVTNGGAVVDARMSGVYVALAKKAKDNGINLRSSSSFRYADSRGGNGDGVGAARPGKSYHQSGLAIDFSNMPGFNPAAQTCATRVRADTPEWKWMYNNADGFGVKQYSAEAWHWDASQMPNRCGKND